MKAIIEKKIRYIDNNDEYIDIQTTVYIFKIPVFWKSKQFVPPIGDSEMAKTARLYKERITSSTFKNG